MSIDTVTETNTSTDLDFPSLWGVKFLNDDYTPMDFVMAVLMEHFNQSEDDACAVMLKVHHDGEAVVGAYTKDIATTKAATAEMLARKHGHPLRLEAVSV